MYLEGFEWKSKSLVFIPSSSEIVEGFGGKNSKDEYSIYERNE